MRSNKTFYTRTLTKSDKIKKIFKKIYKALTIA